MSKIIAAQDILFDARSCVECVFMATADLEREEATPLQAVVDIASKKIEAAIALLDEYRADMGPVPAAPDAKPATPAARTKRRSK